MKQVNCPVCGDPDHPLIVGRTYYVANRAKGVCAIVCNAIVGEALLASGDYMTTGGSGTPRGLATPDPNKKPNGTTCAVCGKFWEFKFDMKGRPLPVKCDHKTP